MLEVYNYPNPFANETYFTFRLSQIPDEVKIRIYTVAGRLIKEITKKASELNYDLNKVFWDGKDEDGDTIACLLYTSDAADERSSVDLGGRRIIKKKTAQWARIEY